MSAVHTKATACDGVGGAAMINLGALLSLLAAGDDDVWDQPHRRKQAPRLCAAATDVEPLIGRRFLFVEPRSAAS